MAEPEINERRRRTSPAITPQALAWHSNTLWMGSRDLRRIYAIDVETWTVVKETDAPGIPWAAVATNGTLRFTVGEGAEDDRYLRSYDPASGFGEDRIACPEFTGSYLSFDGDHLYLSHGTSIAFSNSMRAETFCASSMLARRFAGMCSSMD
jgi:hypothetical protein